MITGSIDCAKIDKELMFTHADGRKFLDIVLFESREKKFGNDGMIVQGISKEARDAGKKGNILGNYKVREVQRRTADQADAQRNERPAPKAADIFG